MAVEQVVKYGWMSSGRTLKHQNFFICKSDATEAAATPHQAIK
jgi:hypothetical protein